MLPSLRIGIPSVHSRLHPKVMKILELPDYRDPRRLTFYSDDAAVFLLRGWDLAPMLATSRLDVVFCGMDTILEQDLASQLKVVHHFTGDRSPISLCKKKNFTLSAQDATIATEYPEMVRKYLNHCFDNLSIVSVRGSTETFAHLRDIHAIVDIVETGSTLESNDLVRVADLFDTYPCMVTRRARGVVPGHGDIEQLSSLIGSILFSGAQGV